MPKIDKCLAALRDMTPAALRQEWERAYGMPAPRISPELLRMGIAYRLQEKVFGGLSRSTKSVLKAPSDRGPTIKPGRRVYKETMLTFARGTKLRREGRAPYLHILRWLADSDEWSLDLREALKANPEHRSSIGQVLDKGFLVALINDPEKRVLFEPYFHFEPSTCILSVEDPKVIFYLKNLIWREFTRQVGFPASLFKGKYDFALSFAGPDRALAQKLYDALTEREVSVFYDENEQHRILAARVEEYLGPIYRRDADYIIALLSGDYPTRIWTKFESDIFRERFGSNAVIPIRFRDTRPGFFSEEVEYGGLPFDPAGDHDTQVREIVETLCRRLVVDRQEEEAGLAAEFEKHEVEKRGE